MDNYDAIVNGAGTTVCRSISRSPKNSAKRLESRIKSNVSLGMVLASANCFMVTRMAKSQDSLAANQYTLEVDK